LGHGTIRRFIAHTLKADRLRNEKRSASFPIEEAHYDPRSRDQAPCSVTGERAGHNDIQVSCRKGVNSLRENGSVDELAHLDAASLERASHPRADNFQIPVQASVSYRATRPMIQAHLSGLSKRRAWRTSRIAWRRRARPAYNHYLATAKFVKYKTLIAMSRLSGRRRQLRPGGITYTNSFQYSLTSYLRTSSTQVVSSPCRGLSRS
jgi:hypothetical protein